MRIWKWWGYLVKLGVYRASEPWTPSARRARLRLACIRSRAFGQNTRSDSRPLDANCGLCRAFRFGIYGRDGNVPSSSRLGVWWCLINFTSVWTLDILEYGEGILKEYLHQYVEMPIVPRPDCQEDYSEVKRLYHDNISVDRTSDKVHKRRRKSESCIILSFSNRLVFILGRPPPTETDSFHFCLSPSSTLSNWSP